MTQLRGRPAAPPTRSARLLYVDNLRTALTALVLVHHASIGYSNVPGWFYTDPSTDPSATLLDLLLVFDQAFFMGAFFLISGLFVPGSYDRKGAGRFLRDRLWRLAMPLVLWLAVLLPLVTIGDYAAARDAAARQGAALPYREFYLSHFHLGPMWFVEVLLLFSAAYVLWRRMTGGGAHAAASASAPAAGRAPGAGAIIAFTVGLAVLTYLWRTVMPIGVSFLGLPSPGYLPQYVAMFIVGLIAARHGWLGALPRAAGRAGFVTAAVAGLVLLVVLFTAREASFGHGTPTSLVMAFAETAFAVGMTLGLLVLFRERFSGQGRLGRWLSANAFAVYVIHALVLVALANALGDVEGIAVAKAALLTGIGLPLCWVLGSVVRALPGARKIL